MGSSPSDLELLAGGDEEEEGGDVVRFLSCVFCGIEVFDEALDDGAETDTGLLGEPLFTKLLLTLLGPDNKPPPRPPLFCALPPSKYNLVLGVTADFDLE